MLQDDHLSLDTFGDCAGAVRFLRLTFDRFKNATLPLLPSMVQTSLARSSSMSSLTAVLGFFF
jgi:hypothetical protein